MKKKQWKKMIKEELKKQGGKKDGYVEANKGYITASKLKMFLNNPQEYQLKFQKGIIRGNDKKCFVMGNAFDTLVSYGSEKFFEEYRTNHYKKDLQEMCDEKGIEYKKGDKKSVLEDKLGMNEKIKLSKTQMDKIQSMYKEASRQPLMHTGDDSFDSQVVVEAEYKGLKIKGTLDLLSLKRKKIADRKTTANLEKFIFKIEEYGYDVSMALYYLLTKIDKGVECDSLLYVLEKGDPAKSRVIKLDKTNLAMTVENKIKPGLDKLIEFQDKYGEDEIRPARYPLTDTPIPRVEIEKSDYYDVLPCAIQTELEYFG